MEVQKNNRRNTAIFYTCGVCNLQCRYCQIDKNPILIDIDKKLEDSFKGDYYINRLKQYFTRGQLIRIETWGGEPFMKMHRIYPVLHQVIDYFPFFKEMYSSTNFSYDTWIDEFFGLMDQFGQYPYRDFNYELQLSCDGPEYINDAGRGQGITQKCLQNFDRLIEELHNNRLPKNITLTIMLKGTWDNDTINKLCSKEKLIEFFQFYENNFIHKIRQLNLPNVFMGCDIPNTAVPSPVTVEEGKTFAQLCKLTREIEKENKENPYFKYYQIITPFHNTICQNCLTYQYSEHTCGSGGCMVGFLPDNMMSICHEGFTELVSKYKELAAKSDRDQMGSITFNKFLDSKETKLCVDDAGYAEHERQMEYYTHSNTGARLATITNQIVILALAKQIDPIFIDQKNALKGAIFIQSHGAYCLKDNYNKTGSIIPIPMGMLKLLLNGAYRYIQEGEDKGGLKIWLEAEDQNDF